MFYEGPQSWFPAISPGGNRVAFGRRDELVIMERRTGQIVLIWPMPGHRGLLPDWSPDGRQVAFGGFDGEPLGVWVLDVESQEAVQVADESHTAPAWSPDGTKLAFDLHSEDVREIWMVETRAIQGPRLNAAQAAQWCKSLLRARASSPGSVVASPKETLLVGKPAPAFTLPDLNGNQVSLSDFRGKIVLLDFWATWCPPCVQAIPHLEALHTKYAAQGLVILGLNQESEFTRVREFAKDRMSYRILPGAKKEFVQYGVHAIPMLFYVGADGLVRHQERGFADGREKEIEARIKELLGL